MIRQSTTVARRQLGRQLRALREGEGLTHEAVQRLGGPAPTKMWKIETGKQQVKVHDVLLLARLYNCRSATTDELVALAEATGGSGFVESHPDGVPESVGMFTDLEAAADQVDVYSSELVPGLLQCPGYTQATISAGADDPNAIEARVQFRADRQAAFFDDARATRPQLRAVITEGAMRVRVGSAAVMNAQLAHLRQLALAGAGDIRVLPRKWRLDAAMRGPFTILRFNDPDDPDLAHVESIVGARYFEKPTDVAAFARVFEVMWGQASPVKEWKP